MQKSSIVRLIFLGLLLYRISCQVAPIYANSAKFQTNSVSTSIPSTQTTSPYNFVVTPSSLIAMSNLNHQRPFISISGMQKLQTDNNKILYLLSQITFSATSFTIGLDFKVGSPPTYIQSWVYNAQIKFYYMLIDSTFPDTYICGQLDIIDSMTNLGNSPDSKTSNKNLNSWISSNVVSLSATDSKFIYAITQVHIQLTGSTNQYSINIKFLPTSNTNFDVTVNTAYSQKILLLRVSLFIYSVTVFDTYLIKIIDNFYISPSLATGISTVSQSYSGWNVWSGMQLIIGWAGLQFSGQSLMGFQFSVDTSVSSTSLNLQVKNIQSSVPKFEVTLFSISQLKCLNGETFIDVARTQCYTVCPIGTYPGTLLLTTTLTECLLCTIANCIGCSSATMCTQCTSAFYVSAGSCTACTNYDPQCVTCNQTQCLTCSPGYFYRASKSSCQLLSSVVCGDSDWVYEIEACDDANPNDNDGCSADCKVETDYVCLTADQLPSGASFCKYNRNFYLEFFYLEKEVSSNTVHLFFKLQPSTFNFWTQQTVEMLLNPVTIVDSDTGNIQTVPVNSLNLVFTRNQNINQIELTIDYDGSNMEGSFLQFNIQPSSTGVTSITHLTTQNNLHLKVDSEKSGVYLFSYSQDVYSFQSLVSTLSFVVGLMALMMLVLGCCLPVGKLIVLECLAVVQISYFSLMQFEKIPPTFIGLKNLMFSNGYNDASMFGQANQGVQDVYRLMGIQRSVISNDNISLIVFVILPILIGLIGYLILKCIPKDVDKKYVEPKTLSKNQPPIIEPVIDPKIIGQYDQTGKKIKKNYITFSRTEYLNQDSRFMVQSIVQQILKLDTRRNYNKKDDSFIYQLQNISKNDSLEDKKLNESVNIQPRNQQSLSKIIFQRMLFQMTFYGILVTSYLSWVSIFHSFSQLQIDTYIYLVFTLIIGGIYVFLFIRFEEKLVQINQFLKQQQATNKIFPQKYFAFSNFGQFSQVPMQITLLNQDNIPKTLKKIYLVYVIQRIISSTLIVFLPQAMSLIRALLIGIYVLIFLGLIIIHNKFSPTNNFNEILKQQSKQTVRTDLLNKNKQKKSLKQAPQNKTIFSYLYKNYILRQSVNILTIIAIQALYLYAGIIMTINDSASAFLNDSIIIKVIPISVVSILFANILFNQFLWIWELKCEKILQKWKIFLYSIFPSIFQSELAKMRQHLQNISQAEKQQAQCIQMINNFMQKSNVFQSKQNPFLGIEEKHNQQAKAALLDVLKIEQKDKFQIPFQAKKRKSWLIQKYWDHM